MMDYYCTSSEIDFMRLLKPSDIDYYYNTIEYYPEGHLLIHAGIDTFILASDKDFKPETFIEPVTNIEYLEDGIPAWMGILPNTIYYSADWTGSEWIFTETSMKGILS